VLVLGPKKRKAACFLTKGYVLWLFSAHTRKVPSRYLKCLLVSEDMLCFTAFCGLLEHLGLKDKGEQQPNMKHYQEGAVCGEMVKGLFWFVRSYKQIRIILHVSAVTILDYY